MAGLIVLEVSGDRKRANFGRKDQAALPLSGMHGR